MCNDSQLDPNFLETFFELFYVLGVNWPPLGVK